MLSCQLIDALLERAGAEVRGGDLFADKSVASKATKFFEMFSSEFQGAGSALTTHKPLVADIINMINSKSLKPSEFPFVEGDQKRQLYANTVGLIYCMMHKYLHILLSFHPVQRTQVCNDILCGRYHV
jgi:hypothetical protein